MAWQPKDELAQAVALELLLHGPCGRSELARRLQLAPATLTRISTQLIDSGLLVEGERPEIRGAGRPSIPLDIVAEAHRFAGVKLASDKLMCAVTDLKAQILSYGEAPLESCDPDTVVAQIGRLIDDVRGDVVVDAVGVGLGGVVDASGAVRSAPFLGWTDVPLVELTERELGLATFAANDLEAFIEAQHWFGFGVGHENFSAVTLGIGVGFGCVANGRFLSNDDSGVGLVGHWPVDPLGPICPRGHRGCASEMLTTHGIAERVSSAVGQELSWDEALRLAEAGDEVASSVMQSSGRALGRLVAAVANLTAPDLVILGGEGVGLAEVAAEAMYEGIAEDRDPRASAVRVELTSGDNEGWCRGAAVFAIQGFVGGWRSRRD